VRSSLSLMGEIYDRMLGGTVGISVGQAIYSSVSSKS